MKRYFITHLINEKFIKAYGLATAGCNFSYNLISGNNFDVVYSILPTNVGVKLDDMCYNDKRYKLVYFTTLRTKGKLFRFLSSLIEQFVVFCKVPLNSSIWTYNVTDLNLFLIWLLKVIKPSVRINVIELDYTPVESRFSIAYLCLKAINNADGNIRLAHSDRFTCTNAKIIPGVVPATAGDEPVIKELNQKFILSGVLTENIAQTSMVLEAFSRMPQCELHITGFDYDTALIESYTSKYSNIIFHGHTSFSKYLDIMHSCTYQLSTRNKKYPENQCNFPSKIIETLLHNRIIISTISYPQLDGINYFEVRSEVDVFCQDILSIIERPAKDLLEYANQGEKTKSFFGVNVWNDAMSQIESCKK